MKINITENHVVLFSDRAVELINKATILRATQSTSEETRLYRGFQTNNILKEIHTKFNTRYNLRNALRRYKDKKGDIRKDLNDNETDIMRMMDEIQSRNCYLSDLIAKLTRMMASWPVEPTHEYRYEVHIDTSLFSDPSELFLDFLITKVITGNTEHTINILRGGLVYDKKMMCWTSHT